MKNIHALNLPCHKHELGDQIPWHGIDLSKSVNFLFLKFASLEEKRGPRLTLFSTVKFLHDAFSGDWHHTTMRSLMTTSTSTFSDGDLERAALGDKRFQEILDLLEEGYSQVLSNEQYRKIAEIAIKGINC